LSRTDGTTDERWLPLPRPTSQTPISRPFETPRGTASDSLLDSLSKVSTMSPNTRPLCPRSEQLRGERVGVRGPLGDCRCGYPSPALHLRCNATSPLVGL